MNSVATSGPAARVIASSLPSHAMRTAGTPSSRMAWLCVAAMPMPSHSAISSRPAVPSHGRSRTSSTKIVGSRLAVGDGGRHHPIGDAHAAAEVLVAGDAVGAAGQERLAVDGAAAVVACG